jgi:rod shape-determining protein MreC
MATPANRRSGHSRRAQYSAFAGYIFAVVGILIASVLLVISTGNADAFSSLRGVASDATAPLGRGASGSRTGARGLWDTLSGYFTSGRETAALRREVAEAHVKLAESAATAEENRRLKALLGLRDELPTPVTTARLIASTSTSTRRFATLSVGANQGVTVGMPVRSPLGLVGRVLEVGRNTARVLLVTDSESVVPVRRASDGVAAFAEGQANGTLRLRLINLGVNPLKRGDAFVTSGSGGLYRPGIPLAVATRIIADGAIANPLSDPGATEFVAVDPVWNPAVEAPAPSESATAVPSPTGKPQ